jgi:DNA-binding IclR family transcriptional regulator
MQTGIKSVEVGGRLLEVLLRAHAPTTLKELAAKAKLAPSAAHRYLVSYQRLGLVRQDPDTRAYDIGPFAFQLGIAAIGRSKLLSAAQELQRQLRDRLDESVVLAVWGSYGPIIMSVEESSKPIAMTMRVGATLPLFRSAAGWIFAAFMPKTVTKPVMELEITQGRTPIERLNARALQQRLDKIRISQLAFHSGHLLPGISAVAVPLLDSRGGVAAAMAVFGSAEHFDASPSGGAAKALKAIVGKLAG